MLYVIALQGIFPSQNRRLQSRNQDRLQSYTPFLGEIQIVSFGFAPKGWAICNGQLLAISQNSALFSLLGTTYGGNGIQTFALPNLQGRVPLGFSPAFPLGSLGGELSTFMLQTNIPPHVHANPVSDCVGCSTLSAGQGQPINNMQPYVGINYLIALQGVFPPRSRRLDPFVAEIIMFAGNFAPKGFAFCQGQILSISQNTALFSLLGTTYGGNGLSTFALPNLMDRVVMGAGQGSGLQNYVLGSSVGESSHAFSLNEIPSHTHVLSSGNSTLPTGGSLPFNNAQPSLVVNYIISLFGVYPSPARRRLQGAGSDPYVGDIIVFPGNFAPAGWQLCDGTLLDISSFATLFNLIGTTYGGDGATTFAVPDLRGRVPVHTGAGISLGQLFGSETVTLAVPKLAAHIHYSPV
jgi:microcystin-dependent protein